MLVAREERGLTNVGEAGELRDPALKTNRKPAVRWHPVAERVQVARQRVNALPTSGKDVNVVLIAMEPLSARHEFDTAKQQIKAIRKPRLPWVRVRVERSLHHRIADDEQELRTVLTYCPLPEPAFVGR